MTVVISIGEKKSKRNMYPGGRLEKTKNKHEGTYVLMVKLEGDKTLGFWVPLNPSVCLVTFASFLTFFTVLLRSTSLLIPAVWEPTRKKKKEAEDSPS